MIGTRQKELLKCIVEEYIKTVKPVGSKSLCKKFKVSSATIRNDMAALEEAGYLEKTHISSGRIPSEAGYRYYVDNLMEVKKITADDMLKLQTIFNNNKLDINDAISKSLEIVSDITNYTSVVLGRESTLSRLQKVEIIPITPTQVVAVVVTDKGHVENKNVTFDEVVDLEEITKTTELLNKMLVGTLLNEVARKLEYEIKPIIRNYIQNYKVVYNAFYDALSNFTSPSNVKFSGKTNILKQPEFNTVDDVKNIISKFESEEMVSKIEGTDDEVKVYIGSENEIDDNVTIVKTKYCAGGKEGTIAVIGPKRMDYERVVNMMEYIKKHIERKEEESDKEN